MALAFVACGIEIVVLGWLGTWKWHIPFNPASAGSAAYWLSVLVLLCTTFLMAGRRRRYSGVFIFLPVLAYVLVMGAGGCLSSGLINARRYALQLGVPEPSELGEQDLPPFDPAQLPWVSVEQAAVLGDKLLGQLGAIGSSVVIQGYTRQEVGGRLYHVAPILHKGFFAYSRNSGGTPGYIMVSMTDNDDVRLVTRLDGRDLKIRVQPAGHAAWGDKLERIVYSYSPTALTSYTVFEIDDELHPYWIVPVYRNTIGWSGAELSSLLIVDAVSGDIQEYSPLEVPAWVDRVQPVEFIEEQLSNWGELRGGYWNRWLAKADLLQSDPGNALVYRDGGCYLFDSLTSYAGSDEATVGFVLVNLRSKAVQRFNLAGATEWAAQLSALGDERVRHLRYQAGFPVPAMVEGQPTYFFSLEDPGSHIAKMFALVNIAKHQITGVGATIQAARIDYLAKLRGQGLAVLHSPGVELFEVTGRVLRRGQYTQGGETYYNFIIDEAHDRILLAGGGFAEAPLTQAGDRVHIRAMKTEDSIWSLVFFDNLEFSQAQPPQK